MFFSTVAIAAFAALAAASPVKRDFGGRATYYATGLGACGQYSSDSDFIVALNAPQYGSGYPGPECFKQIQISANGKTATATIMDLCPGCGYGDLDMSPSLFNHFADPSVGVFQMNWDFVGSAPAPAPATSEAPQTSSTPEPSSTWVAPSTSEAPSSTWVAPTTSETPSSTWVAPSTTAEASSSAWVASSSSAEASSSAWVAPSSSVEASSSAWVAPSSSVASSSAAWTAPSSSAAPSSVVSSVAAPIPTITVELGNQTIAELYAAVAQMGELVIVGAYNGSIINASSFNATSFTNATATPLGNTTILFQ